LVKVPVFIIVAPEKSLMDESLPDRLLFLVIYLLKMENTAFIVQSSLNRLMKRPEARLVSMNYCGIFNKIQESIEVK